jgi:hypothetical protein
VCDATPRAAEAELAVLAAPEEGAAPLARAYRRAAEFVQEDVEPARLEAEVRGVVVPDVAVRVVNVVAVGERLAPGDLEHRAVQQHAEMAHRHTDVVVRALGRERREGPGELPGQAPPAPRTASF